MHVLQEYNNPNRPFEPCPNFSAQYSLQRSLPDRLEKGIRVGNSILDCERRAWESNCYTVLGEGSFKQGWREVVWGALLVYDRTALISLLIPVSSNGPN